MSSPGSTGRFPGIFLLLLGLMSGVLAWTPLKADTSKGEQLFNTHCAACHGTRGAGGVGVPLSLPAFINSVDDDYLKKTIHLGRPGRIMPAFAHLKSAEVNELVNYIRSWTGIKPKPYPRTRIKGDAAKGKTLFAQYCAGCHGVRGEGGHGTGVTFSRPRDFPILAPALNNSGFLGSASDSMIKATLTNGRKGTPMVSFAKVGLSEADINNLVAFIRGMEPSTPKFEIDPKEPEFLSMESPFGLEKTISNLKQAVVSANMRLIRIQNLDEGFVPKEKESRKNVMVYSCGFNFLNEALKIDPRVGVFLPCRVTVVERAGKVTVMTVNPKRLAYLFNNSELTELCSQMKSKYLQLMEEATF